MSNYLEIMSGNKIYSQRTPTSKFVEFSLDGIKQNTYEELPNKIKEISLDMIDMEQKSTKVF